MNIIEKNTINLMLSWIKWFAGIFGALFLMIIPILFTHIRQLNMNFSYPIIDGIMLGVLVFLLFPLTVLLLIYIFQLQKNYMHTNDVTEENSKLKEQITSITNENNKLRENRDGLKQSLTEKQNQLSKYENNLQLNSNIYTELINQRDITIRSQAETIEILREKTTPGDHLTLQ